MDVDAIFAALGDPMRRRLLEQLSRQGPLTATQLAQGYPVSRQAVVKHLTALSGAGLLSAARNGREVRYRVEPQLIEGAAAWLADVGARWDRRLGALQRQIAEAEPRPPG